MNKVYVSCPYNGGEGDKKEVEKLIIKLICMHKDNIFISPVHTFSYLYDVIERIDMVKYRIELLKDCDILLLGLGWNKSEDCMIEYIWACEHGMNIIDCDETQLELGKMKKEVKKK